MMSYSFSDLSQHAKEHARSLYMEEMIFEDALTWRFSATGERVA